MQSNVVTLNKKWLPKQKQVYANLVESKKKKQKEQKKPEEKKKDLRPEHGIIELKDRDLDKIIENIILGRLFWPFPKLVSYCVLFLNILTILPIILCLSINSK